MWTAALLQYNASFLLFVGCKKIATTPRTTTTSIENRKQSAGRQYAGGIGVSVRAFVFLNPKIEKRN